MINDTDSLIASLHLVITPLNEVSLKTLKETYSSTSHDWRNGNLIVPYRDAEEIIENLKSNEGFNYVEKENTYL